MGKNPYMNFVINYISVVADDGFFKLFSAPVIPCNQPVDVSNVGCIKQNCKQITKNVEL